ncbi:hypothetical protein [Sulfitobacter aestuariivivens]|uniref:hypothetical protein n=1 Tax=Sulfitobacter aestuariivivens TaxID=2766981 RepID=UPI0036114489
MLIETHRNALLPREGFAMWFDDALGDQTDLMRAQELGKRDWSMSGIFRRKVRRYV